MNIEKELYSVGGLIYHIPDDKIMSVKNSDEFPSRVKKILNLLKFPENMHLIKNEMQIFGTYNLKIQPYYGDIDIRSKIVINLPKEKATILTKKMFQSVVKRIEKTPGAFFTDAKAGVYDDGEAVHWRAEEIYKGKRNGKKKDFNGNIGEKKLLDAILDVPVYPNSNVLLKIDAVVPFYGKYLECTNVYDIYYIDENGEEKGLNVKNFKNKHEETQDIISTLIVDTKKQRKKKKFFKVIKRIFSLSRYYKDFKTADIIIPLLISNVSKLSSINSDLKTLELLIFLDKNVNNNFIQIQINMIIDKLVNILDIDYDSEYVIQTLKEIYYYILNKNKRLTLKFLDEITEYLNFIINNEVVVYLNSIGFSSFYDFGNKYII